MTPSDDRSALERELGVSIAPELLELALTHRSWAYENGGAATNERLEFLGDSILGQAVTVMLYTTYPELSEGDLAKRRASLVSSVALAEVARSIGLGEHLKLGKGEELTGGREKSSILADPDRFGAAMDPKTSLQELAAQLGYGLPVYAISDDGPDHSKIFTATVLLADEPIATGEGTSKKQAEMAAALEACVVLQSRR